MRRVTTFLICLLGLGGVASAEVREVRIASLEAMRAACAESQQDGPRRLYSAVVPSGSWRFAAYDPEEGFLVVDTRRNLRTLGGSVELIPARLEPIGFVASEERADVLVEQSRQLALSLRVGFFLGFDSPSRTMCVLRSNVGVTTARIDVAYVELVDAEGRVYAREESERLRAYSDDAERNAVPGEGPRAAIGEARVVRGAAFGAPQRRAFADAQGTIRGAVGACYAAAVQRGASHEAQLVVRLTVDAAAGTIQQVETEISSLGDAQGNACIGEAFRGLRLPAAAAGPATVVEVPVRLVAD
ncbi:MAG: hypothetical protein U0230_08125 [Polyangiales bacterium]